MFTWGPVTEKTFIFGQEVVIMRLYSVGKSCLVDDYFFYKKMIYILCHGQCKNLLSCLSNDREKIIEDVSSFVHISTKALK